MQRTPGLPPSLPAPTPLSLARPVAPLFSGWNWHAVTLPRCKRGAACGLFGGAFLALGWRHHRWTGQAGAGDHGEEEGSRRHKKRGTQQAGRTVGRAMPQYTVVLTSLPLQSTAAQGLSHLCALQSQRHPAQPSRLKA